MQYRQNGFLKGSHSVLLRLKAVELEKRVRPKTHYAGSCEHCYIKQLLGYGDNLADDDSRSISENYLPSVRNRKALLIPSGIYLISQRQL